MALPSWMGGTEKKSAAEEQQELELKPEEVKSKLDKIDGLETSFSSMKTSVDSIAEFIQEQKAERESARARAAAEQNRAKPITEEDWLLNPEDASRRQLQPLVADHINLSSQVMRKQILGDEPEYEYYTGEFKKKVDAYIDSLPLNSRADPNSIKNCYHVVLGQHATELREAKLKSKFTSSSSAATGTGGTSTQVEKVIRLTDEEKRLAKVFDMTEKEYGEAKKDYVSGSELSYV